MERAITEARRAIDLGPENFSAYRMLMKCLLESRRYDEAAAFGPEWLSVSPFETAAHSSVAVAMAHTGDLVTAARQFGYVMILQPNAEEALDQLHKIVLSLAKAPEGSQRFHEIVANAPDSPRMLDEVAWFLATYPDSELAGRGRGSSSCRARLQAYRPAHSCSSRHAGCGLCGNWRFFACHRYRRRSVELGTLHG